MAQQLVLQLERQQESSFYLISCGHEVCKPLHSFGPALRPNYLLHYILDGKGQYFSEGNTYHLEAGQGFLITPENMAFYQADVESPWTYIWLSFDGDSCKRYLDGCGLSLENPVFTCPDRAALLDCVQRMMTHHEIDFSTELLLNGLLYEFLSIVAKHATPPRKNKVGGNHYLRLAIAYIEHHYQDYITVQDIADYLSLNRCYLSTVFRKVLHISPQQFLQEFRISKAEELLSATELSIGAVARSCGYADPLAFSKTFHKLRGMSPSNYRHQKPKQDQQKLKEQLEQLGFLW